MQEHHRYVSKASVRGERPDRRSFEIIFGFLPLVFKRICCTVVVVSLQEVTLNANNTVRYLHNHCSTRLVVDLADISHSNVLEIDSSCCFANFNITLGNNNKILYLHIHCSTQLDLVGTRWSGILT